MDRLAALVLLSALLALPTVARADKYDVTFRCADSLSGEVKLNKQGDLSGVLKNSAPADSDIGIACQLLCAGGSGVDLTPCGELKPRHKSAALKVKGFAAAAACLQPQVLVLVGGVVACLPTYTGQ